MFLAHSWSIFPIFGVKKIQLHMGFLHHAKIQKKLMIQFQENARTDGRTERPYFIGPFRLPPGVQYKEECFQMFSQDIMV